MRAARAGVIVAALFPGCVPPVRYHAVRLVTAPPRLPGCAFDLFLAHPSRPFEEIGVAETSGYGVTDAEEFRVAVAPLVCQLGGDAVVAEVHEGGDYPRGVIVRYVLSHK